MKTINFEEIVKKATECNAFNRFEYAWQKGSYKEVEGSEHLHEGLLRSMYEKRGNTPLHFHTEADRDKFAEWIAKVAPENRARLYNDRHEFPSIEFDCSTEGLNHHAEYLYNEIVTHNCH